MALWFMALYLISANFGLQNGDFTSIIDGKATGWQTTGQCRVLPNGGRNGMPAIEIECKDGKRSFADQNLVFDSPRKGDFVVSAWIYLDEVQNGSECSLWLDVLQKDADPMWGVRGFPVPGRKGWQHVKSIVRSTHPVTQVHVYLMQDRNGKARFCDVRVEELPFKIDKFKVKPGAADSIDIRAGISDEVEWQIRAVQDNKEIWTKKGEGRTISDMFSSRSKSPVTVHLIATLNGQTETASCKVNPQESQELDWWVENSLTRVFQDDITPDKRIIKVGLDMARNERESFQVCLRALSNPLSNVTVTASDLVSDSGTIPSSKVEWNRVGYVWVEKAYPHPYAPRGSATWWPDPLLPPCQFNVEAGQTQPLWFTVHIPEGTAPGRYKGRVTIHADGVKEISVPVTLDVWGATIPVQGRMKTAFSCMDAYLNKLYGKMPKKLRHDYIDFLLENRLNPDDISRTTPPDISELRYADARGLNAFNILHVVPERDKSEAPIHDYPSTWICYAPLEAYTPKFKQQFMERLDKIVPELEKYGLIDKAYIYGFDERGPEYIPIIQDLFGEIKKRYPKIHTLSTCWPPPGTDPQSLNVDWYVPLSSAYDQQMAKQARERGDEMWWYVCMGPRYPYANWLLEHPLIEARLIWWQAFDYDVEGMLYWIINFWEFKNNNHLIKNTSGPRLDWTITPGSDINGDGILLYPGETGPIGCIRLANIRDGLEDIEVLHQYRQKFGSNAEKKMMKRVTIDRTNYSRDPADLMKSRSAMLKALTK
ncbi:MAG: glycoside hydrolase domain-containing protein [Armatimonadota bacterium]